jgi:thioesterase domain-containing protein
MEGNITECAEEAVIDREMSDARIVQLKSGRPGPCVFLVPGTGGRVEGFATLATLLQTAMPVFAIEARGVDGTSGPDSNIDELVKHYLHRVRTVQETGPYFLIGHSFGGMVVFEMAQQFIETKEKVACLILLDTPIPRRYWPLLVHIRNSGKLFKRHLGRLVKIPLKQNITYYSRRLILHLYGLHKIPADMKIDVDIARVLLANEMLFKKWSPRFYPDKLTLFCSSEINDLETLWRGRVRELETHSAAGGHLSLIEWPNVSALAIDISTCLTRALSATTPALSTHWGAEPGNCRT